MIAEGVFGVEFGAEESEVVLGAGLVVAQDGVGLLDFFKVLGRLGMIVDIWMPGESKAVRNARFSENSLIKPSNCCLTVSMGNVA